MTLKIENAGADGVDVHPLKGATMPSALRNPYRGRPMAQSIGDQERVESKALAWAEGWAACAAALLSDEAVEAAARAANLDAGRQRGLAFDDDWDEITEQERGGWRLVSRAALSAALRATEGSEA